METAVYIDQYKCEKNVDIVRFIESSDKNYILSACYELDKNSNNKSGGLNLHSYDYEGIKLIKKVNLDYGVLDFKTNNCGR